MGLERKLLQPVRLDYRCDECGIGNMRPTGVALMTNPPMWPHRCTYCKTEKTFGTKYPNMTYEEVKDD